MTAFRDNSANGGVWLWFPLTFCPDDLIFHQILINDNAHFFKSVKIT